ncbi:MAG: PorV/PorQ family protein [Lewinellaceae bacterium]|nr:PorV/PorQ family protein [Lewinellaceae bacterium]MCB9356654.1 PorV/PorQ family protein [Lewinellaceae bacterium]
MNHKYIYLFPWLMLLACAVFAGNPDRQGEAGANQLLVNPWARSAGLHTMGTANVTGAEAMFLNVAGLSRIHKTQLQLSHTRYLVGSDINLNALGFGQRIGQGGAFGISLVAFDLGDFDYTTEDVPEGSGATFSPSFFNMGISYAHLFANKVSVGLTLKFVNEGITNARASAMAIDAGVQYVTGEKDNFKFGISLRNIGSKMRFEGEGLSKPLPNPGPTFPYDNTYYERSSAYDLPSQLNIGLSNDWLFGNVGRITMVLNFTSNAFSRDQVGGGLEFGLGEKFALRAGYKYEFDAAPGSVEATLDNGFSGGFTVSLPVKKGSDTRVSLDYAYRNTELFEGIHNIGLRLDL